MKKLKISLSDEWVLEHRDDKKLPTEVLKSFVERVHGNYLSCRFSSVSDIYLDVKNQAFNIGVFIASLSHFLEDDYSLDEPGDVFSVEFYDEEVGE